MGSWVYLFSKFTSEALLFEGLIICTFLAGYSAFWLLKKRRYGVADIDIPAPVVKGYLNELIRDAEVLRAQLFGLLKSAGIDVQGTASSVAALAASQPFAAAAAAAADPGLAQKITGLEAKMQDQEKAMREVIAQKEKIEKELAAARAASANVATGSGESGAVAELQAKINKLEGRLMEYSVIEDDLANLKRLQQENAQLKAALSNNGIAAPSTPAKIAAAPAVAAPAAPGAPIAAETNFESLVTQVEQSLQPEPQAETKEGSSAQPQADAPADEAALAAALADVSIEAPAQAAAAAPVAEGATSAEAAPAGTPAPAATPGQTDADLVAEFEKMLNA